MTKRRSHFFGKMVAVFASVFVFNATASDWTYYPGVNILTDGTFGFTASVIDGTTNHLNVTAHIATYSNNTHSASLDLKNGTISDANGNLYEITKWGVNFAEKSLLTAVHLPSTITSITGKFGYCQKITEFNFESPYVTSLPSKFLQSDTAITSGRLYLPALKVINDSAFDSVSKWAMPITNVLHETTTYVGDRSFYYCSFTGDVKIVGYPQVQIPTSVFYGSKVSSVDIDAPEAVTVWNNAFRSMSECRRISLNLPKVYDLKGYVFMDNHATNDVSDLSLAGMKNLTYAYQTFQNSYFTGKLLITNLCSRIPDSFAYNSRLRSIEIHDNGKVCTTISAYAFSCTKYCHDIELDLPYCDVISTYAFENCWATNDISKALPPSVTTIASCAYDGSCFRGVADLSNIAKIDTAVFRDSDIDGVIFGQGLTTMAMTGQQFRNASNLKTVSFADCDIDAIAGTTKINPTYNYGTFYGCGNLHTITFLGAAPTNCVDEASGTNLVTNGRLFIDAILCSAQWSTNSANAYKNVSIYANPTNGWSNYAQPIDPAIDGPAPEDAYGVYVTAGGNRKAWLCQERGWTYNPTRRLLTDGRWGFTASVISGTNLNVTGHHADYTNTVQSGILDLKDKTITGTDGKTYSIQQWSVKFTQSHPVSKIVLPSTIKNVTGTFTSCTNLQEFVFESDLVDNLPSGFITSCSILSNGVVRLPNLTTIRGNAFRWNGNFSMPITNVVHKNLKSLGSGAFRASAMTGDVVITNLQDTVFGAYTFNLARNVTSIDITAPNMYNFSLHAFDNMSSCTSIVLTTSARTMLGAQCFQNDIAYNDISDVLTPYVYYLGDYTFDNTKFTGDADLTSITTLSKGAFRNSSISSATFSKNMESFNCVETFANSKSLRELTFNDCDIDLATASTTIDLDGTTGPFYNCSNIVSVTFRGGSPSNSTDVVTNGRKFLDALVASGVATKDQTDSKKSIVFYAESNKGWKDFASPLTAEDGEAPDFCYGVYVTTAGERKAYMVRRPKQFIIVFR